MAISGKPTDHHQATNPTTTNDATMDMSELLSSKSTVRGIYVVTMLLLAIAIVWSGIKTAEEVQQYHQDYKTLQDMKKQERTLKIEHQRLLIEQQTFSATPQIASRAVSELGMFSPALQDKMIIQPSAPINNGDVDNDVNNGDINNAMNNDDINSNNNINNNNDITNTSVAEVGQ